MNIDIDFKGQHDTVIQVVVNCLIVKVSKIIFYDTMKVTFPHLQQYQMH